MFRKLMTGAAAAAMMIGGSAGALAEDAPAMWRLKDRDSTIYLFGTFHILPEGVEWKTKAYEKAMADAETTMTEADVTSPEAQAAMQQAIGQHGLNPQGVTLSSLLGEERAARFAEVAQRYGVPMANLEPLRPWLATLSVSVAAMMKAGYNPESGVESVLLAQAKEEGDAIDHFESAGEQVAILGSLDDEEMLANFDAAMDDFDNFDALMERMLTAWSTGDIKVLEEEFVLDIKTESPDAFEKLLAQRNRNWVEKIEELMAGEGDYFVAVGAGHLVGEESVVDLLEEADFKVKRVQ